MEYYYYLIYYIIILYIMLNTFMLAWENERQIYSTNIDLCTS